MTYESKYQIVGLKGGRKVDNLTLYQACRELARIAKEEPEQLQDGSHIQSRGRYVAFFDAWKSVVEAMWQARKGERRLINQWMFVVNPRLYRERKD